MKLAVRLALAAAVTTSVIAVIGAPAHGADEISDGQWYLDYLNVAAAHKITQGEGVRIAVVDSGIDTSHPDLQGSVLPGVDLSDERPGDGLTDTDGHGTSMASLIVGHGRIRGIAPKATVVSVRVTVGGGDGGQSRASIGEGIYWAIEHQVKIISVSLSGADPDLLTEQAIQEALAKDIVIVAGVGNMPVQNTVGYPARYQGVLAVSGLDRSGNRSPVSVTGPQISLAAPSDNLSTSYSRQRRMVTTGTSNSAALTAGAAALLWAKFPDLSAAEIVNRLTATATDKGAPGRDAEYGYGAVNLMAALTADVPPLGHQPTADPSANNPKATSPISAPGAEFPSGIGIAVGVGCVLVVLAVVVLVVLPARRRRT